MNLRKLRKLKTFLKAVPERFTMGTWLEEFDSESCEVDQFIDSTGLILMPPCETAACLAGQTVMMEDKTYDDGRDAMKGATEILGLSNEEADRLFRLTGGQQGWRGGRTNRWPVQFSKAYRKAKTPSARVKVACDRIDHFIETKGAE
jgi:hypothetical protein